MALYIKLRPTALQALSALAIALLASAATAEAAAAASRSNILVIFDDDVGYSNVSLYHPGVMGCTTPNIDRIGREGGMLNVRREILLGRAAERRAGHYPGAGLYFADLVFARRNLSR